MINKTIHYCWFGGNEKNKKILKCINSWKKYCPNYEIVEWNETNFNISMNEFTKMAYNEKKYAFLSDYARLWIVYNYGGVYLDTDVELIKSLDDLLNDQFFIGFENNESVATGLGFGAEKNNINVKLMLMEYDNLNSSNYFTQPCPILNTTALKKNGLKLNGKTQKINNGKIYAIDYFNPLNDLTGDLNITNSTYSIHWYTKSWFSPTLKIRNKVSRIFHKIIGVNNSKRFHSWKERIFK